MKLLMLPPQTEVTRAWAARLLAEVPNLSVMVAESLQEADALIGDAEAAYGALPLDLLRKATRLRWLQCHKAAPLAGYYYPELVEHPLVVTNFREIYNDHIGAHIMMFVLSFARAQHVYMPRQFKHDWMSLPKGSGTVHLSESTVLIVGVGGAGAETARLLAAFGAIVIGVDARRESAPPGVAELHRPEALDTLLPQADFVILTVPHTPATEGFFGRTRFQKMKPSAFFINVGRGKTTRLNDLVAALKAGEIAGAGLDVLEQEPLPADHPLWTLPGVILTPHVASRGPHLDERRFEIVRENCRRLMAGQSLRNVVDKKNWF